MVDAVRVLATRVFDAADVGDDVDSGALEAGQEVLHEQDGEVRLAGAHVSRQEDFVAFVEQVAQVAGVGPVQELVHGAVVVGADVLAVVAELRVHDEGAAVNLASHFQVRVVEAIQVGSRRGGVGFEALQFVLGPI